MASNSGVWGIEIGQSALKALRCSVVDGEVVADAFDYIEYPKILSQPEAVPEELVAEAITQLLEHNDAFTDKVCISVPGQSGLAKFFKPPPVEVKKVADIVRYEARQQIPFDLADVVWDFQMMPGSMVEEGYALESEVGLFAMKREQAYRQLAPFNDASIEVDIVQMAPLAIYNMIAFDRMHERLEQDVFDVDNPPPSSVVLSIGTDSSDLIITNGFRIWQRSMPIGGNHFTRQLTKDLKLTFAKAEHLKRNAREAVDPKLIFQTMRPIFNDLVTEVQRSIGFFRSIDKKAEIGELLITGNTVKMPGLAAYLGKNLGFEVHILDRFNRLSGDDVLTIPTFRDNAPTFAVCYGLCLQGLGLSQVHASLVPHEILTQRMIRAKKPWTLAGLAALMIGMAGHYAFTERSWAKSHEEIWGGAARQVKDADNYAGQHRDEDSTLLKKLEYLNELGKQVSGNAERRLTWLEVVRAVNSLIPRNQYADGKLPSPIDVPFKDRTDFHITEIETKKYADVKEWWTEDLAKRYREEMTDWSRIMGREVPAELATDAGPSGPGWVIQLRGFHYFNDPERAGLEGSNHVRKYLTSSFLGVDPDGNPKPIVIPDPRNPDQTVTFTPQQMGLIYPLLLDDNEPIETSVPNPDYDPEAAMATRAANPLIPGQPSVTTGTDPTEMPSLQVRKLEFVFQVVWQEKSLAERLAAQEAARKAAEEEAAKEQAAAEDQTVAMQ